MACCEANVDWECVYPNPCPCGPTYTPCVCQYCSDPNNCSLNSSICGKGACGTCDSSSWQFAWKTSPCPSSPCPGCVSCGGIIYFGKTGTGCQVLITAHRCDTENQGSPYLTDLTKAAFMQLAQLSAGHTTAVVTDNGGGPCC